ncbi:MAG: sodium/proline symporter [Calditrichia bacterium]
MTTLAFLFYLGVVVFIGVYATRFSSSGLSEFFIGGRQMNRFVVALSAVVSGRSAWLLLGVTGMAYKIGSSAVWAVVGYILVEMLLFLFYAPRLRRFSEKYDCITVTDFFSQRFEDHNNVLRVLLSILILIFMISYVAAQILAGGKAFSASFSVNNSTGMLITAAIVLFYTMLGGFYAVSLTDVVQAFMKLFSLIAIPVIAIVDKGGWQATLAILEQLHPQHLNPMALSFGAALGFLGIGLGSPGNPHILARYMSIKDPAQLKVSAVIGTAWNVLMAWGAIFIGLVGRTYFPEISHLPGGDTEKVFPMLGNMLLHPFIYGLVLSSIFAAIMSTADSQILVAVSAFVRDIYQKVWKIDQQISQQRLVWLSRVSTFVLILLALLLGVVAQKEIFWLVLIAWAGLGASLGPTSIFALFWRKTTRAGVLAGLLTGAGVTALWYYTPALKSLIYELVPAFLASFFVTWLVSIKTDKPRQVMQYFEVLENKK